MKERCKQLMLGTFKTKDIHCLRHSELRTPHCAFVPGGVLLAQDGSSRSAVAARRKTHVAREDVPILDVVLGKLMTSMVKRVVTWGHSKTASKMHFQPVLKTVYRLTQFSCSDPKWIIFVSQILNVLFEPVSKATQRSIKVSFESRHSHPNPNSMNQMCLLKFGSQKTIVWIPDY